MTPETPEFSRPMRLHDIGSAAREIAFTATPDERAALVKRFDLLDLEALTATLSARTEIGGIRVTGRVVAKGFQPCGLSGAPVNFAVDEPVDLRFVALKTGGEDIELSDSDLDVLPIEGEAIDLGEAAAQSFGLALDPYPRAPDAELPPAVIDEDKVVPLKRPNPFAVLKRD